MKIPGLVANSSLTNLVDGASKNASLSKEFPTTEVRVVNSPKNQGSTEESFFGVNEEKMSYALSHEGKLIFNIPVKLGKGHHDDTAKHHHHHHNHHHHHHKSTTKHTEKTNHDHDHSEKHHHHHHEHDKGHSSTLIPHNWKKICKKDKKACKKIIKTMIEHKLLHKYFPHFRKKINQKHIKEIVHNCRHHKDCIERRENLMYMKMLMREATGVTDAISTPSIVGICAASLTVLLIIFIVLYCFAFAPHKKKNNRRRCMAKSRSSSLKKMRSSNHRFTRSSTKSNRTGAKLRKSSLKTKRKSRKSHKSAIKSRRSLLKKSSRNVKSKKSHCSSGKK